MKHPGPALRAVKRPPQTCLAIALSDGLVWINHSGADIGNAAKTVIATICAEELDICLAAVRMDRIHGATSLWRFPYCNDSSLELLRSEFACIRRRLESAAALRWSVHLGQVCAAGGRVIRIASGAWLSYGELAEVAARLPVAAIPCRADPAP